MALIVEDGTGLDNSNAYIDVAFADAYFTLRGNAEWLALSTTDKESAIVDGTDYADLRWGPVLSGRPLVYTQALQMPRYGLYDRYGRLVEGVPEAWKRAVCEYAYQSSKKNLIADPSTTPKEIKRKKTVVGPITTEVEYVDGAEQAGSFIDYTKGDAYAKQFVYSNGGVIRA